MIRHCERCGRIGPCEQVFGTPDGDLWVCTDCLAPDEPRVISP